MSRRASSDSGQPQTVMDMATIRPLTYGSLDYATHPIDLYDGPQGWGPFYGPWTPWDFRDPAADLAFTYGMGESNEWQFAPDYDVMTLFADNSLSYDWNTSYDVTMDNARDEQQTAYSSTIANVVPNDSNQSFLSKLSAMLQPKER